MQRYWFGDFDGAGCQKAPTDVKKLAERLSILHPDLETFVPLQWEQAIQCGFVTTRSEYIEKIRSLCFFIAQSTISSFLQRKDEELVRMVRVLDEMDEVINHLLEPLIDWYNIYNPSFSRKMSRQSDRDCITKMRKTDNTSLYSCLDGVENIISLRSVLASDVNRQATVVLPNCCALVGGIVAARLLARAGGLERLAKMPSARIQVLGAENALFSHLQVGSPSPKHGIIFQHQRIHNAPRKVRGKVARVLAGRLSIAAKFDYQRGTLVADFVEDSQNRINRIGGFT